MRKKILSKIGECVRLCLHKDGQQNMHLNIHIYTNGRLLHIIKVVSNPNLLLE